MAKSSGRKGRRWRRLRERVKRNQDACWLCGDHIDKTLEWPDPKSFSVDHVEPLSLRPELAEVYSNARAAHLGCNSSRGTGQKIEQPQSRVW